MKYAPVVIITLNRDEHLRRCIASLQKNEYAKYTDIYIGLDYPPNKDYEDGYARVKEYLGNGIDGFKSVNIIEHKQNVGVTQNALYVQNVAYKDHDRVIFTEDDNEFAPNYLEYIDRCLEKYEEDKSVLAISGYNYPIESTDFNGNVFLCKSYFSAFGYAMWRDREKHMKSHLDNVFFEKIFYNRKYMTKLKKASRNQYVNMVKGMIGYIPDLRKDDEIRQTDLSIALYMMAFNMKMVFPTVSKVRNWGYDGSGVNCGEINLDTNKSENYRNFNFNRQCIDTEFKFGDVIETNNVDNDKINRILDKFFCIPNMEVIRTDIAYLLTRILGLKNMRKIINWGKVKWIKY